jgi:hypothetical protein
MLKIYKIIDNTNGNVYIGKTKQKYLTSRLYGHTSCLDCISRKIIKNGDYKIELIEETEDDTRERYWILNTECINKQIPGRTIKEWQEDNKEKIKRYKKQKYKYESSWGGDKRAHNNLLMIDPNLFF